VAPRDWVLASAHKVLGPVVVKVLASAHKVLEPVVVKVLASAHKALEPVVVKVLASAHKALGLGMEPKAAVMAGRGPAMTAPRNGAACCIVAARRGPKPLLIRPAAVARVGMARVAMAKALGMAPRAMAWA